MINLYIFTKIIYYWYILMSPMFGVINGLYTCNHERVDEINNRISDRNLPSNSLQPQYSIRPVPTKYGYMPILDQYKKTSVPDNKENYLDQTYRFIKWDKS